MMRAMTASRDVAAATGMGGMEARGRPDRHEMSPGDRGATSAHFAIVSYGYPPIPHVCGTRPSAMAAQLVRLGYAVTVVTLDWREDGPRRPRETVEDGVHVVRVDPRVWRPAFDPTERSFLADHVSPSAVGRNLWRPLTSGPWPNWARSAARELLAVHERHPVDVVWAIHGSASCHEAAARFRRSTGVPWVADFKDPWNPEGSSLRSLPHLLGTRRRLRSASALTETCEAQGVLDARFGRPWHLVWSGYDSASMNAAAARRTSEHFTLAYYGTVNPNHDVARLASVLRRWKEDDGSCGSDAEFHVFSHKSPRLDRHLGSMNLLRYHDPVPRSEAYARMKGADLLILLAMTNAPDSRIQLGVKELEYFASGTPVLCIGKLLPELRRALGDLPQLVEATDDTAALTMLREEHASFRAGRPSSRRVDVNAPAVAAQAWDAQARRLAKALESSRSR